MKRYFATVLPILVAVVGCGSIKIPIARYEVAPAAVGPRFLAGAAKVDITPPPGYPMGGHSIGGRMARGYWTRLYARAFYFQHPNGNRLILVSCDLFAIPAGLHAAVAEKLKLPPESLILSATHTHHGPAGYMSSAVFNFGGPLPGYDDELFHRLTAGIVEAIGAAKDNANQAGENSVALRSGFAPNLQRNRAIDAFYLNDPADTGRLLDISRAAGVTCPDSDNNNECPRYQAVDPTLKILEVLRGGRRIGLLVFYAIHATAMSHDCTLYQADLAGDAMNRLEQVREGDPPVIAGFFNGAEGDISPRWVAQNRHDVTHLGKALADAVTTVLGVEAQPEGSPEISAFSRAFPAVPPAGDTKELTLPGSGVGELGGAEDGRTLLYAYGWHGGITSGSSADQKMPALDLHKLALLRILKPIIASPKNYPQRIPVAVATLGSLSLAAIPTEMTTVQGLRVRQMLQASTGRPHVLVGLANEYIGYTTSEAEYAAQNYEGSSTMYGKNQGRVIGELLVTVAKTHESSPQSIRAVSYDTGSKFPYRFGPEFFGERYRLTYEDLEPVMPDPQSRPDDSAPRFEWREARDADWRTRERSVKILRRDPDGWKKVDDDSGANILTALVDGKPDQKDPEGDPHRRIWTAIWTPPKPLDRSANYIFWVKRPAEAVKAPLSATVCSATFQLGGPVIKVPMDVKSKADCPPWSEK